MSKHTPGPWVVCPKVGHQIPIASAMDGLKLNIAHAAGIRDGEGFANARLIAAVPDLLEALEKLVRNGQKQNWNDSYPDDMEAAKLAILKAKNEWRL